MFDWQSFEAPLAARLSRRQALKNAGAGFGYLALAGMLGQDAAKSVAASGRITTAAGPLAP